MTIAKNIIRISYLFLAVSFLFFLSPEIADASHSGKGWYRNFIYDASNCGEKELDVRLSVFDTGEINPLIADTIIISVARWDGELKNIETRTFQNTSYVEFCVSLEGYEGDIIALDSIVYKDGYKTSWGYQKGFYGSFLVGKTLLREVYLARNDEEISIAQVFPLGNEIVNYNDFSFEADVGIRPESDFISKIVIEIINEETKTVNIQEFIPTQEMVNSGTVLIPADSYPDGIYLWRVRLMEDNRGFLYPNLQYSRFLLDTTAPTIISSTLTNYDGTKKLSGTSFDSLSGPKKTEIFLDGVLKKTCEFDFDIYGSGYKYCTTDENLSPGDYVLLVKAEDYGGLKTEKELSFTIGGVAKIRFRAYYNSYWSWFGFNLNVDHIGGFNSGNSSTTTYILERVGESIETEIQVPNQTEINGELFHFYRFGGLTSCDFTSGTTCKTSANLGQQREVSIYYKNTIDIISYVYPSPSGAFGIGGLPIKKVSGSIGDFENGETSLYIKSSTPVNAVLEAPLEHTFYSSIYEIFIETEFSHWSGCSSSDNNLCTIVRDPYMWHFVSAYYRIKENTLKVSSFVDDINTPGAEITRISGTEGTGGITDYTFSVSPYPDDLITKLQAPEIHGERIFSFWEGCDDQNTSDRTCDIKVNWGKTKEIFARFGLAETSVLPEAQDISVRQHDGCSNFPTTIFSFKYSGADNAEKVKITIFTDGGDVVIERNVDIIPGEYHEIDNASLEYEKNYNWQIEVWDNKGRYSGVKTGPSFQTNRWPIVNFTCNNTDCSEAFDINEEIEFKSDSSCPSSSPCATFNWEIESSNFSSENTSYSFSPDNTYSVKLTVTDSASKSCSKTKNILIERKLLLPRWREIIPF